MADEAHLDIGIQSEGYGHENDEFTITKAYLKASQTKIRSKQAGSQILMHTTLGLRIARVHPPILRHTHRPAVTLAPLSARAQATAKSTSASRVSSPRRSASTAPQTKTQPPKSASEIISSSDHLSSPLPPSATLNPPASTRPPPLDLPTRDPKSSIFRHLFRLGKAYTNFYKTGLFAILTNRRLLASSTSARPKPSSSLDTDTFPSRADTLLRDRVRHDLSRLPVFALLVLVCGEFTPLVVLLFPRLAPYTCRIPRQVDKLRRSSASRRAASFRALRSGDPDEQALKRLAPGHVCRSLGLTSAAWDRVGLDSPFAAAAAERAVARIAADDEMIREGGGLGAVVDEEVVLACENRGMDVRDQPVDRLRSRLQEWLRRTAPEGRGKGKGKGKGKGDAAAKDSARKEAEEKVQAMLLES
ncbi:hypothetical protein GGR53DRAFT_470840 [Hypoxylon sp. FL1150]|nr:hypothetical protein GGR53DRAFT_470840 [Hypoxylon sp. FL1150]